MYLCVEGAVLYLCVEGAVLYLCVEGAVLYLFVFMSFFIWPLYQFVYMEKILGREAK
jgi:hypothetical protein